MKSEVVLQFAGREIDETSIKKLAEKAWTAAGHKVSEIKSMKLYAQPENAVVFYVINDDFNGSFDI